MIQRDPSVTPEQAEFQNALTLTSDELGLIVRTPKPEEAFWDIEEHLREIGLYSSNLHSGS
jgi:hypothetical protein